MVFEKGMNRVVICFPRWGIVFKFAQINILNAFLSMKPYLKSLDFRRLLRIWRYSSRCYSCPRFYLFRGIVNNWNEFRYYKKDPHVFLQPTHLSLLGLLNVQKYGSPCGLKAIDLWCQLHELTSGAVFADSHEFAEPKNFTLVDGKLIIMDYGSEKAFTVIKKYGSKIYDTFDPLYSWEERLKIRQTQASH